MNAVSEATINNTPPNMMRITTTRRNESFSRRKAKANMRTKMREDDLHMAEKISVFA